MSIFTTITGKNHHHRAHLEERKVEVKKIATMALTKGGFNPKDARYKSQKGMMLNNKELLTSLALQALPILLLALFLMSKYVF
jgi:hypothetical protein